MGIELRVILIIKSMAEISIMKEIEKEEIRMNYQDLYSKIRIKITSMTRLLIL